METILNSKELSLVDASNDQQATCSEIGGLRTLDGLKCGFELEVMGKRHLDERASHHVQDLDQGIDGSHHRAHHLRKQ